jgi:hypothetical protein
MVRQPPCQPAAKKDDFDPETRCKTAYDRLEVGGSFGFPDDGLKLNQARNVPPLLAGVIAVWESNTALRLEDLAGTVAWIHGQPNLVKCAISFGVVIMP